VARYRMCKIIVIAATLVTCFSLSAESQTAPSANYSSFETEPGKPVQLGYYAQAHNDCSPSKLPIVRIIEPPLSGTLTVRPGELKTDRVANCPGLRVPAQIVLYQARDKATGSDHVMYGVTYPDGEIALYDIAVHIKEPSPRENKL